MKSPSPPSDLSHAPLDPTAIQSIDLNTQSPLNRMIGPTSSRLVGFGSGAAERERAETGFGVAERERAETGSGRLRKRAEKESRERESKEHVVCFRKMVYGKIFRKPFS